MKSQTFITSNINKILQDQKLKGKHVIIVAGHVYTASTGKEAVNLFHKLIKKYPGEKPTVTYVPKAESLILVVWR